MSTWQNGDGLLVKYAGYYRNAAVNRARAVDTDGAIKQLVVDIDLTCIPTGTVSYSSDLNNDGTVDGFSLADPYIPANAVVLAAELVTVEAAAGGTSFTIGTYGLTGTAIAATGLVTATEGVLANINAAGKAVRGAGSHVVWTGGLQNGVGTADAFIGVGTTGTFTAGKLRLVVRYLEGAADAV